MKRTKKLAELTVLATTACLTQAALFAQEVLGEWPMQGLTSFTRQGTAVIEDIDGDLLPELVLGTPVPNDPLGEVEFGMVEVIGSLTGTVIRTYDGTALTGAVGYTVHALPDLDGDELPEIMTTGKYPCKATVFWSRPGPPLVIEGPTECALTLFGYGFGHTVLAIADEDGDGRKDLMIGAPGAGHPLGPGGPDRGLLFVVSSSTGLELYRKDGGIGQRLGQALANAGDHNGDGHDDVWVGAPGHQNGAGAVILLDGATSVVLRTQVGPAGGSFGSHLVAVPDQNGDGLAEVVTTAPLAPGRKGRLGQGYLIDGLRGDVMMTMQSHITDVQFGTALAFVGDTDGDGRDEVAFAVPHQQLLGPVDPGYLMLFSLDEPRPLRVMNGEATGDNYSNGLSLSGGLDWDGDGLKDIAVAAFDVTPGLIPMKVKVLSQCYGSSSLVCEGTVSSSGQVPKLTTCAVIDYDRGLHLGLSGFPPQAFVVIMMSPGEVAGPLQALGHCLGMHPTFVRLTSAGPVFNVSAGGTAHVRMSLSTHARFPTGGWLAGTTWAFQAQYFDVGPGLVQTDAWSDAIGLTLP